MSITIEQHKNRKEVNSCSLMDIRLQVIGGVTILSARVNYLLWRAIVTPPPCQVIDGEPWFPLSFVAHRK